MKVIAIIAAIIATPLALLGALILTPFLPFLLGDAEECARDGIVPASKRYDQDFLRETERRAKTNQKQN